MILTIFSSPFTDVVLCCGAVLSCGDVGCLHAVKVKIMALFFFFCSDLESDNPDVFCELFSFHIPEGLYGEGRQLIATVFILTLYLVSLLWTS